MTWKNENNNKRIYIPHSFDGFTDNTRGYFTSCAVFFQAPQGRGKMQETSKMSAGVICKTIE